MSSKRYPEDIKLKVENPQGQYRERVIQKYMCLQQHDEL